MRFKKSPILDLDYRMSRIDMGGLQEFQLLAKDC